MSDGDSEEEEDEDYDSDLDQQSDDSSDESDEYNKERWENYTKFNDNLDNDQAEYGDSEKNLETEISLHTAYDIMWTSF